MGVFSGRIPDKDSGRTGDLAAFVDEGYPQFNARMSATNPGERSRVVMAQYLISTQDLLVEYKGGATWKYSPVSPDEAAAFHQAPSWGKWLWTNVRVRGTVHQHQIDAKKVK